MKKTLIISAAPNSTSFTHKIVNSYKKWLENKWQKEWENFEIIDLYDEKFSQKFLKFENTNDRWEDSVRDLIQQKMTEADEYVFVFPVWWWWVPAIMKNFFDSNLTYWFAYKFSEKWQEKLLSDKTAKVFCTCWAPSFVYKIPFILWIRLKTFFAQAVFGFCGIKLKWLEIFWKIKETSEEKKLEILGKIEKNI